MPLEFLEKSEVDFDDSFEFVDGKLRTKGGGIQLFSPSETPVDTGLKWIDGRSIFSKTVILTGNLFASQLGHWFYSFPIPTDLDDIVFQFSYLEAYNETQETWNHYRLSINKRLEGSFTLFEENLTARGQWTVWFVKAK